MLSGLEPLSDSRSKARRDVNDVTDSLTAADLESCDVVQVELQIAEVEGAADRVAEET